VTVKVKDLPPGPLLSIAPDARLSEVARQMRVEDSDSIAVMSDGHLIGIITERDMVRAIADGVDPKQATAGVIMTADPVTAGAEEDVSVVALRMMSLGVRHLPVVDAGGNPIGLLSARNLVAVLDRSRS
jgi:CBS domain-containing protein